MHEHRGVRKKIMRVLRADLEKGMNQVLVTLENSLDNTLAHYSLLDDSNCMSLLQDVTPLHTPLLGFNGQVVRANLLLAVLRSLDCDVFVETGTYRGETSLLIAAQTTVPVFTCELNEPAHKLSAKLLEPFGARIQLTLADSRQFLQSFLSTSMFRLPFFYLDAHWNADIPLLTELELIISQSRGFVIVIDDFKVPFDSQFKYDTYGATVFEESYIAPTLRPYVERICLMYPAYPCSIETGAKRGFCMIAPRSMQDSILDSAYGKLTLAARVTQT
jgi:predicted O-methyltransferase YrrM